MSGRLLEELKQTRPFSSPAEELVLNLMRTCENLGHHPDELLKAHQLSREQYNVLRILRGAGDAGLPCNEIAARMVTRSPDITRLLDKLETRKMVRRKRSVEDRRVIVVRIAAPGLALLQTLDEPMRRMNRVSLKHMSEAEMWEAIALLEKMRSAPPSAAATK